MLDVIRDPHGNVGFGVDNFRVHFIRFCISMPRLNMTIQLLKVKTLAVADATSVFPIFEKYTIFSHVQVLIFAHLDCRELLFICKKEQAAYYVWFSFFGTVRH